MSSYLRDLSIALIGGGITIFGVYWTIIYTMKMNHTKFLLDYNEASVYIKAFLDDAEFIYKMQNSRARLEYGKLYVQHLNKMSENFYRTVNILSENNFKTNVKLAASLRAINESAPFNYYKDLNGLIIMMGTLHNSLREELKYVLPECVILPVEIKMPTELNLLKQLRKTKRRFRKMNCKLKI